MPDLKRRHEMAVGERFVAWYNEWSGRRLSLARQAARPDLVYQDGDDILWVELASVYYNDALDLGLVATNPCVAVRLPMASRKSVDFWTPDQLGAVLSALAAQRKRIEEWARDPKRFADQGLVLPKRSGARHSDDGPRRHLQPTAEALGLPGLTFHELRHLHASLAISLGASAKALQARLGHSSIDVTLDMYSHLWGTEDRDLADRFDALSREAEERAIE